jgi:hypothetical protein
MSLSRFFIFGTFFVFGVICFLGYSKKSKNSLKKEGKLELVQEIILPVKHPVFQESPLTKQVALQEPVAASLENLPEADRIERLFALDSSKLSIVETISYTSRAPWMKGRPAWIADYASHFGTSRHFIARSLNRKTDYMTQKIAPGDRFNVFKKDRNIQFHLLIDLSRCRMWFYCLDLDKQERMLLKTYRIGLGRIDSKRKSGYLTPVGKYLCGEKIAIYKPGTFGFFQDQKVEMIRIFGTRWIPFDQELDGCSESAKGFGLHGAPWVEDPQTHTLVEDLNRLGKYDSDGCIRLASSDIEEIFSIVITKPTVVELVKDFHQAKLFGVEKDEL